VWVEGGGGGEVDNPSWWGTSIPRTRCPGEQLVLVPRVQGDIWSGGTVQYFSWHVKDHTLIKNLFSSNHSQYNDIIHM